MRVLIIEDDISKALAFEIILNKLDVNDIVTVDEWNKAEEIMNLKRPDFVIADLHLFGVSILNKLCYFEENGIPFIICTAYPSETIMDSALKSNAANVIVIPAHKDILTYNFKRMIQISRIQTLKSNDLHLDNGNVLKVSFNYRENLVNLLRNSSTSH